MGNGNVTSAAYVIAQPRRPTTPDSRRIVDSSKLDPAPYALSEPTSSLSNKAIMRIFDSSSRLSAAAVLSMRAWQKE